MSFSALLGTPAPPSATTRRRTATATGDAPLLCRLWIRARRGPSTICPECQHPAASPTVATDPVDRSDACSCRLSVPTVPIPSDRDCVEPIGTPIIRPPSTPGDTQTAPTKFDVHDDVDEPQFADSVLQFSHDDWDREHQIAPTCHAKVSYTTIGRPPTQSPDFLSCYPSQKRSFLSDTQELTNKDRLHTSDNHSSVTRGGVISVIYKTHWLGLSEPSWEREMHATSPALPFFVIEPTRS